MAERQHSLPCKHIYVCPWGIVKYVYKHENVEPWPYAHKNCPRAAKTTQLSLHISEHLYVTYDRIYRHENVETWPYAHNKFQHAAKQTKLANCLAVASALCMCFCCCCASHTQSSWPVVVQEVRKHSQTHVKMMSSRTIRGWLIVVRLSSQSR